MHTVFKSLACKKVEICPQINIIDNPMRKWAVVKEVWMANKQKKNVLPQINIIDNPMRKWADVKKSEEEIWMANKQKKKCSYSPVFRGIQRKIIHQIDNNKKF